MQQSKNKTAEQCLVLTLKDKKKPKIGFQFLFRVVRVFITLFTLYDKYEPKLLSLFSSFME